MSSRERRVVGNARGPRERPGPGRLQAGRRHHVVIVGCGFGGLRATKTLRRADVDVPIRSRGTRNALSLLCGFMGSKERQHRDCARIREAIVVTARELYVVVPGFQVEVDRGAAIDSIGDLRLGLDSGGRGKCGGQCSEPVEQSVQNTRIASVVSECAAFTQTRRGAILSWRTTTATAQRGRRRCAGVDPSLPSLAAPVAGQGRVSAEHREGSLEAPRVLPDNIGGATRTVLAIGAVWVV